MVRAIQGNGQCCGGSQDAAAVSWHPASGEVNPARHHPKPEPGGSPAGLEDGGTAKYG